MFKGDMANESSELPPWHVYISGLVKKVIGDVLNNRLFVL